MPIRTWASEFKQFLLRGNVVEIAVGIVIGVAFNAVVQSLVKDLLTPLISAIFGQHDFSDWTFRVNNSLFRPGSFVNAVISFVTIAFAVYFFVVKPVNTLVAVSRNRESDDPSTRKCPECLSEIPLQARRCAHCTAEVGPVGPRPGEQPA
jgi:large conductance mechanosensitive channel